MAQPRRFSLSLTDAQLDALCTAAGTLLNIPSAEATERLFGRLSALDALYGRRIYRDAVKHDAERSVVKARKMDVLAARKKRRSGRCKGGGFVTHAYSCELPGNRAAARNVPLTVNRPYISKVAPTGLSWRPRLSLVRPRAVPSTPGHTLHTGGVGASVLLDSTVVKRRLFGGRGARRGLCRACCQRRVFHADGVARSSARPRP